MGFEQILDTEKGSPAESIYPKLGYIKVRLSCVLEKRKLSNYNRWARSQAMGYLLLMDR